MIESCSVCGSNGSEIKRSYRSTHPIFTRLKLAHCSKCNMVFATPMPCEATLNDYNASYFASAHGERPGNRHTAAFFSGIARLRLSHLDQYLGKNNVSVSSLLELGPGPGFFARIFLEKHLETKYMAIETDTSCHSTLQKMGVNLITVSALAEDTHPVDLVVMSHVLEHVTNPIRFLTDATRNLRKDGALFIEVPCRDWEHKPIDEPHLLFFDKGPMHLLLKKLGFHDIQVSYHGQEIDRLRTNSPLQTGYMRLRTRLIALGLVRLFSRAKPGMEVLTDPLERAIVAPFQAHCETHNPSWWLRVLAKKSL